MGDHWRTQLNVESRCKEAVWCFVWWLSVLFDFVLINLSVSQLIASVENDMLCEMLFVYPDTHCSCGRVEPLQLFVRTGCDLTVGEGSFLCGVPLFSSR